MPWIANEFLAREAVALGRLVLSVENPEQDFFAPPLAMLSTLNPENIAQVRYESFQETLKKVKGSKLAAFLTKLLSLSHGDSNSLSSVIEAAICMTYTLKNSGSFFAQLCEDATARKWMERALKQNRDVFLVVGIKTLTDAKVVLMNEMRFDNNVKMQVPIDATLVAGGAPVPLALIGGVGVSGGKTDSASMSSKFEVPGEQIYATQFRKLEFKLFSKRTVDNAFLAQGNRWTIYPGEREASRGGFSLENILDQEPESTEDFSKEMLQTELTSEEIKIVDVELTDSEVNYPLEHVVERAELGDESFILIEDSEEH